MWTHNIGVVSLIPPCVMIKAPLVRRAMGNYLTKSMSLANTQSPVFVFCNTQTLVCKAISLSKVFLCIYVRCNAQVLHASWEGYPLSSVIIFEVFSFADLDERKVFESINLYGGEDVAFFLLQLRMLINGV